MCHFAASAASAVAASAQPIYMLNSVFLVSFSLAPFVRLTVYLSLYYVTALFPLPLTRLTTAAALDGDLMTRVKLQLGVN